VSFLLAAMVASVGCSDAKTVAEEVEPAPAPVGSAQPAQPEPEPKAAVDSEPSEPPVHTMGTVDAAVEKARELYADHRTTALCGCQFTSEGRVALGTCGYQARADEELARRVAWEQLVPVRAFGAARPCWRNPNCADEQGSPLEGVECCRQSDRLFVAMESDLHNIVPVVAELKQDRSSYGFGEIEHERRMYGQCDVEVDRDRGVVEPHDERRGDIARAYLYMHETYGNAVSISPAELEMYRAWHEADPPDPWEIQRNAKIAEIQGHANPFIPLAG
jgi:deoxyribonuclease-1